MTHGLNIPQHGAYDLVSLGALVHRLDPGIVPFRKATECAIHVSGGEFNCAANLADAFRMRTAVVSAMVDSPIGALVEEHAELAAADPLEGLAGPGEDEAAHRGQVGGGLGNRWFLDHALHFV